MELLELLKILHFPAGATLQQSRHKYKSHAKEVEFSPSIIDVKEDYIVISQTNDTSISLNFDQSKFTEQLLSYSGGDDIRIKAEVVSYRRGWTSEKSIVICLKLISITKLGTTFFSRQSAKRQAVEESIKRTAHEAGISGAIKLGFQYALGGMVFGGIIEFFSRTAAIIIFLLSILFGACLGYGEEYEDRKKYLESQKMEEKIEDP